MRWQAQPIHYLLLILHLHHLLLLLSAFKSRVLADNIQLQEQADDHAVGVVIFKIWLSEAPIPTTLKHFNTVSCSTNGPVIAVSIAATVPVIAMKTLSMHVGTRITRRGVKAGSFQRNISTVLFAGEMNDILLVYTKEDERYVEQDIVDPLRLDESKSTRLFVNPKSGSGQLYTNEELKGLDIVYNV